MKMGTAGEVDCTVPNGMLGRKDDGVTLAAWWSGSRLSKLLYKELPVQNRNRHQGVETRSEVYESRKCILSRGRGPGLHG